MPGAITYLNISICFLKKCLPNSILHSNKGPDQFVNHYEWMGLGPAQEERRMNVS